MTKTWVSSKDERVRDMHADMEGVTIPYEDDFVMPDGVEGFAPGIIGAPQHDINCRCTWKIDLVGEDEKEGGQGEEEYDIMDTEVIQIGRTLGAKAFNYKVWVEGEGLYSLAEGTTISKIVVFAGKGTKTPVKVAEYLSQQYGGKIGNWMKARGEGYVDFEGEKRRAELHWFENVDVGRIKMKVKRWFD